MTPAGAAKSTGTDAAEGFPPIAGRDARVLVLGSLPGKRSIAEQQYYGHPRNAFWPIMKELFGIDGVYEKRLRQLKKNRVAVWDVLQSAIRPGSLDADIQLDVARANDFANFFRHHAELRLVLFNGKKAESMFARFVDVRPRRESARLLLLPSTSPAYAALSFSGKLDAWRAAFGRDPELDIKGKEL